MKQRCNNPKDPAFKHYGGRGIYVCEEWTESFAQFQVDMGPKPSRFHTIDRINNNGPYAPTNCRWATRKEQQQNRRGVFKIEYKGVIKSISEWATEVGLNSHTLYYRLIKWKWPIDKALTKKTQRSGELNNGG